METLIQLVSRLKPAEIRLIKSFYKISADKNKLRLKLLEAIIENSSITDREAAKSIYKSLPNSAFSHLKSRLKEDILNVVLLQGTDKIFNSPFVQAEFNCRKAILQADLLMTRGVYEEAINILTEAARLAEKYELPAEQILIEDTLRSHLVMRSGETPFDLCTKNIENKLQLFQELLNAKKLHYQIIIPHLFKANRGLAAASQSKENIKKLKKLYSETKCVRIGFFYYIASIGYYNLTKQYKKALSAGIELYVLVTQHPAVKSDANVAGACLEMALTTIRLKAYSTAIGLAENALQHFKPGMLNELLVFESLFLAYFHGGYYRHAQDILKKAFAHSQLNSNKFYPAKWLYFKANLEFINGHFDASLEALRRNTELMKDKSGWLLGYNLLEIMNLIEKRDYEWFEFKLDNFKKLLQRQKHENIVRCKLICEILTILQKQHFNFKNTFSTHTDKFKLLIADENSYTWDPLGYELIRFDDWFAKKTKQ